MKKVIMPIMTFAVVGIVLFIPISVSATFTSTSDSLSGNVIPSYFYDDSSDLFQITNLPIIPKQNEYLKIIDGDKLIMGGQFQLHDGDVLNGDLLVLGGIIHLEEGATINGNIAIMGGKFEINCDVQGDLIVVGGAGDVQAAAKIDGDVFTLGSQVNLHDEAVINGEILSGDIPESGFVLPSIPSIPSVPTLPKEVPNLFTPLISGFSIARFITGMLVGFLWYILRSFMWAIVAILVVLFFSKPVDRVAKAVVKQAFVDFAMGLLTAFAFLGLIILFAVTIIGIPISLLIILVFLISWAFGVISIGNEVGKRLSAAFNQHWAPAVEAGVGVLLLTLVTNGIGKIVPCVGWLLPATVGVIGLGAVVMTKFGSADYPAPAQTGTNTALDVSSQTNNQDLETVRKDTDQENSGNPTEK